MWALISQASSMSLVLCPIGICVVEGACRAEKTKLLSKALARGGLVMVWHVIIGVRCEH